MRRRDSRTLLWAAALASFPALTGFTLYPFPVNPWPTVYTWPRYIGDPLGQYDTGAIPLTPPLSNDGASPSPTNNPVFLTYVNATLPERASQLTNTVLFPTNATDEPYNLYLKDPAKVEISFVYEGAGYRNSLGYFTFDPLSPPAKSSSGVFLDKIIFPNASLYNSGGTNNGLRTGDTVELGTFTPAAGQTLGIGFFLVADGYQYGNPGGVRPSPDPAGVFYSLSALNPETLTARKRHMVLIRDPVTGLIALAMEDMNRNDGTGCDHDFNDVVYRIKVTPESAVANLDTIYAQAVPDNDKDGVPDTLDEFPTDPARASSSWYPSKTGWNTLAFEDVWPSAGDYDMNDLVLKYRYREILRADGAVKEVEALFQLVAMGSRDHNGFAVELTGIPAATPLDSATLKVNGGTAAPLGATASVLGKSNTNLVYRVFADAYTAFGLGANADQRVNTVNGVQDKTPVTYQLNVALATPVSKGQFTYAPPYNPFLWKGNAQAVEIHLPGRAPTSAADLSKFGTADDNSSASARRYYVTTAGHPWALNLSSGWKWPTEGTDIVRSYPDFKTWAESGGAQKTGWYLAPSVNAAYTHTYPY